MAQATGECAYCEVISMKLLRLKQIIGSPDDPSITPIIPVGRTTWWEGVRDGRFPKPVSLGKGRARFWRSTDIEQLVESARD